LRRIAARLSAVPKPLLDNTLGKRILLPPIDGLHVLLFPWGEVRQGQMTQCRSTPYDARPLGAGFTICWPLSASGETTQMETLMNPNRRNLFGGLGGALAIPMLPSLTNAKTGAGKPANKRQNLNHTNKETQS